MLLVMDQTLHLLALGRTSASLYLLELCRLVSSSTPHGLLTHHQKQRTERQAAVEQESTLEKKRESNKAVSDIIVISILGEKKKKKNEPNVTTTHHHDFLSAFHLILLLVIFFQLLSWGFQLWTKEYYQSLLRQKKFHKSITGKSCLCHQCFLCY